jgi:NAD(P)-dependent dehydrogenase (short-subunit alcohol dehydrogenase family)
MSRTSLRDKTVVITGAGSGIGRALAQQLDARGCRLALSDVDVDAVEAVAPGCRDARAYALDVRDRDAVVAHAVDVVADFGGVDVVINNAGVALAANATEQTFEDFDWVLDVNLKGVVSGSQAFLPHLIASGDGHLVNVSSVFGIMAMPSQSAYNTSKFGVRGYTEALAIEMRAAGRPVQVHCVHPGGIKTNIANNARVAAGRDQASLAEYFNRMLARTSPEAAARTIIRGIERGKSRILVGPDAHAIDLMERVLGSRYQQVIALAARLTPLREDAAGPAVPADDEVDGTAPTAANH